MAPLWQVSSLSCNLIVKDFTTAASDLVYERIATVNASYVYKLKQGWLMSRQLRHLPAVLGACAALLEAHWLFALLLALLCCMTSALHFSTSLLANLATSGLLSLPSFLTTWPTLES